MRKLDSEAKFDSIIGETSHKATKRRERGKFSGSDRGAVLEARVPPQSFHDVLDDPHAEVCILDLLLRAFDLQVNFSCDQPPQVPEKLFIFDIGDPSIGQGQFRRAGDRRRGGSRARGAEWGRGNPREWQWQGKQSRIKIDVVNVKGHARVPRAFSTGLNSVLPRLDDLRKNCFCLG